MVTLIFYQRYQRKRNSYINGNNSFIIDPVKLKYQDNNMRIIKITSEGILNRDQQWWTHSYYSVSELISSCNILLQ